MPEDKTLTLKMTRVWHPTDTDSYLSRAVSILEERGMYGAAELLDAVKDALLAEMPLAVGDKAKWRASSDDKVYEIVHIQGDKAWVTWEYNGTPRDSLVDLDKLVRA